MISSRFSNSSKRVLWASGLFAKLALLVMTLAGPAGYASEPEWRTFANRPYDQPAYPESTIAYERLALSVAGSADVAIEISGVAPTDTPYFGFTVYDQRTGTLLASDATLGSPSIQVTDEGRYTVYAAGAPHVDALKKRGYDALTLYATEPKRHTYHVEIWYRVYDYRQPNRPELPQVRAIDPKSLLHGDLTEETSPRPLAIDSADYPAFGRVFEPTSFALFERMPPLPTPAGLMRFYRPEGIHGLYANPPTEYMVTRFLHPRTTRDVAVVQFREPPVSYWSLCMVGGILQRSGQCLSSSGAVIEGDTVTTIIATRDPRSAAERERYNYLPWTRFRLGSGMLYRNLLPAGDGAESLLRVPRLPMRAERTPQQIDQRAAHRWIGPYAPVGIQCHVESLFSRKRCDWRALLNRLRQVRAQLDEPAPRAAPK